MERKDYAQKFYDIKNEILKEIRSLIPEDTAHRFNERVFVHFIEGEVATTEVCTAVEVWHGGMVVFIINDRTSIKKEVTVEGEDVFQYDPESFIDILDHLKNDLREKKLDIIRTILKENGGSIDIKSEFEFLCADEGDKNTLSKSLLKGLEIQGEKILVKTIWKEDHQQYDYHDHCMTDDELDNIIACLKSQCKKKFRIRAYETFSRIFEVEAFDYDDAVKIARQELESLPFEEGDSDGLCFD